jgi:hypothetical protein
LYRDTVLVVTTRGIQAPSAFFGRTVLARFRTDVTELGSGLVLDESGRLSPIGPPGSPAPCSFEGPRWATNVVQDCFNCEPRIELVDPGPSGFRARGAAVVPGYGGYVVGQDGALRTFSLGVRPKPAPGVGGPSWPGADVARGVTARSSGKGGYVLDAFGGLHGFTTAGNPMPARTRGGPRWPGWDIARGVALLPSGAAGYVLDGYGGLHGFAVGSNPMPPAVHGNFETPGWDIARGLAVLPGGAGGYVVDAVGNLHPFGIGANPVPAPLAGADLTGFPGARGLVLLSPVPAPAVVPGGPASAPPQPYLRWKRNTWRLSLNGVP